MARTFRFRPEVLLRLRQRRQDAAQSAVEQACAEVNAVQARLSCLRRAMASHDDFARRAAAAANEAPAGYRALTSGLRAAMAEDSRALGQAAERLRQCRRELLEAMRQRKAVARLKERLLARHNAAADRQAAKDWDDTYAAYMAARSEELT